MKAHAEAEGLEGGVTLPKPSMVLSLGVTVIACPLLQTH